MYAFVSEVLVLSDHPMSLLKRFILSYVDEYLVHTCLHIAHVRVVCVCVCVSCCIQVIVSIWKSEGQCVGVLIPPCRFWGLNSVSLLGSEPTL